MKNSKFKKFISAIKPETKKESVKTNEDEYTEVVSGTETISSSNHIMRTVSTLTAAAVLVTGIGVTGFMIHKNNTNISTLSEEEVVSAELADIADIAEPAAAAPFADFKQIYFGLGIINDYDPVEYSDAAYDKLAAFLNSFDWGEENRITVSEIPDFDNYEGDGYNGKGYVISWRKGDVWYYVYVTEEGKAYYKAEKCDPEGNCFYYPVIECSVYNIDYKAFDKGIQDIRSSDVPDASGYLSKSEKMYLTQGEFLNGTVEGCDNKEVIPKDHKSFNALQGFLRDDFAGMLQKDRYVGYDGDELIYTVACYYKTSATTTRRLTYYISGNGVANLCEYELTDNAEIPTGCTDYYIDIKEFETVLSDIFSGKYDDKYSFEVKSATTAVTASTASTETETTAVKTTEQVKAPEEEPKEETVVKETTDEDVFRAFYLSENNGWDGSCEGTYEAIDENGNMVDYKERINFMLYRAEMYFPSDRVLGPIIDEEDAIAKGREILLRLNGQEYIDSHEIEYVERTDGTKIYRDNPCYIARYNADYDIWTFCPMLFSGSTEDGRYHIGTPGTVPVFYIRGCDGKILACFH